MVDNMALQMVQNQKLSADTTVRIQNLEQKILEITGSFEEKNHSKDLIIKKDIDEIKKKIAIFQELDQNNQSQIDKGTYFDLEIDLVLSRKSIWHREIHFFLRIRSILFGFSLRGDVNLIGRLKLQCRRLLLSLISFC